MTAKVSQNLYAVMAQHFPRDRSACAMETEDGLYYSWADVEAASAKLANLLVQSGLKPGDRVAVQVDKSAEAVLLYLACLRSGMVFLPLNVGYQPAELEHFIADALPTMVVCGAAKFKAIAAIARAHGKAQVLTLNADRTGTLLEKAAALPSQFSTVPVRPESLAAILYTSGTTGRSKGAMLSHHNMIASAQCLKSYWGWAHDDVLLHALPIFHVHGLFVALHGALINGSKMLFHRKFDAAWVLRDLARATVFMGVPTMYVRLLDDADFEAKKARNIRLFISGSAPLLAETFNAFEQRTGKRILERYGMTETNMLTSNPLDGERLAGTVGLPLPGVAVRVTNAEGLPCAAGEVGGIEVKGDNVFAGYWQMPEKTREEFSADGYFKTGDVGKIDRNGYVTIVGRSKDLIISGGYNVYPKEIELVLDEYAGVLESAVIGVPDRDFGEAVTAVVVLKPGAALNESSTIEHLKTVLARFKVPKRIHVVAELPRNAMGKVQKNELRKRYA